MLYFEYIPCNTFEAQIQIPSEHLRDLVAQRFFVESVLLTHNSTYIATVYIGFYADICVSVGRPSYFVAWVDVILQFDFFIKRAFGIGFVENVEVPLACKLLVAQILTSCFTCLVQRRFDQIIHSWTITIPERIFFAQWDLFFIDKKRIVKFYGRWRLCDWLVLD